jgi:hypothetical protein
MMKPNLDVAESRSIQIIHHEPLDESDIEVVLPERVIAGFRNLADGWIFMTPVIELRSTTLSPSFLRLCLKEDRRWIRRAQKVFGRSAVKSPKKWMSYIDGDGLSRSKKKMVHFLHWSLHCRGNLFSPTSLMPVGNWRKLAQLPSPDKATEEPATA